MARLLVIDDDKVFAKLIAVFLQQRGHDVSFALDGHEGIECFKTREFDGVVCDIVMPDREGIETIREIRGLNERVAIVAISGGLSPVQAGNVDVLDLAELLGADLSLKKPFPLSELAVGIDRALAARRALAQPAAS
jgi:DNA-binding response OmpR family regulator